MILGTDAINHALLSGLIVCDPAPTRIEGAHIDVTLGRHGWVLDHMRVTTLHLATDDPAEEFRPAYTEHNTLWLPGRGFMLAHTEEYIGTVPGSGLVPVLHTRSTLARWGLSVHQSAGWGDEGYTSRWTLEIVNPHGHGVALPIGARVGCIVFQRVQGSSQPYAVGQRYNHDRTTWTPRSMLPRKGNW